MLKFGLLFGVLLATGVSANRGPTSFCYNDVGVACGSAPVMADGINCNAKYGGFEAVQADLQAYANAQIDTSFKLLLISSHFGNYEANRDGFKGLYRKLSDKAWNDAIDIIKFIAKRGGKMNFNQLPRFGRNIHNVVEETEISSLAKVLDIQKELAEEAFHIHTEAEHHSKKDASVAHFMEEKFMEEQAETIRTLAGHTSDLKTLLVKPDASLSVFLFDEYLKKTL